MHMINEFLEAVVHNGAHIGGALLEIMGIAIIIVAGFRCIIGYIRKDEHMTLDLIESIATALEFLMGGEVLHTVLAKEVKDLIVLAVIVVIRITFTFLLNWEKKEHDHQGAEHAHKKEKKD